MGSGLGAGLPDLLDQRGPQGVEVVVVLHGSGGFLVEDGADAYGSLGSIFR